MPGSEQSIRKLVVVARTILAEMGGDLMPMDEVLRTVEQASAGLEGGTVHREVSLAELELIQLDLSVQRKLAEQSRIQLAEGRSSWSQIPGGLFNPSARTIMSALVEEMWTMLRAESANGFGGKPMALKGRDGTIRILLLQPFEGPGRSMGKEQLKNLGEQIWSAVQNGDITLEDLQEAAREAAEEDGLASREPDRADGNAPAGSDPAAPELADLARMPVGSKRLN
jgi:hypothetical protein